jgi:hypothetical protein
MRTRLLPLFGKTLARRSGLGFRSFSHGAARMGTAIVMGLDTERWNGRITAPKNYSGDRSNRDTASY